MAVSADGNIALVLHGKGDLRLEEKPILEPRNGEVQIEMQSVTICGSDVSFWVHGQLGTSKLNKPVALGHEGSGVVSKIGPGVTSLKVGDRVSIEPATPCQRCKLCTGGKYNLCSTCKGLATPECDGNITRYIVHSADFCHKLPDNISFPEAALMEPLSVCLRATQRAGVKLGDNVLIIGAGAIGIMNMLVCRTRGVGSICMTDISQSRLDFAKKMGVNHVLNVKGLQQEEVVKKVEECFGEKPDVTMECSGAPGNPETAVYATASGGTVMLVGVGATVVPIPVVDACEREVNILGTYRYMNCFPTAISMVSSGLIDVKPLLTHSFDILDCLKAFDTARNGEGIKVTINCARVQ